MCFVAGGDDFEAEVKEFSRFVSAQYGRKSMTEEFRRGDRVHVRALHHRGTPAERPIESDAEVVSAYWVDESVGLYGIKVRTGARIVVDCRPDLGDTVERLS